MTAPTVLRTDCGTSGYRSAVATIIADIERATGDTLIDIAENIDASRDTISNAKNKKSDLSAVFLARLGARYGGAFLNPYLALFQTQAAPLDKRAKRDVLPLITRVTHKIACARDPAGPGGTAEVPQEKSAYLPDLKELNHELGCQIAEIEEALS